MAAPIRYTADIEQPEAETARQLVETMRGICETTFKDSGHAFRSVHAKSHALLRGTLTIADALPVELAQGLFARPGTYPVVMRFSTNPGDVLDDSVSTPRGLAIKVIDAEGERLPGSEGQSTQDFVMVNAPAFGAPTAAKFLKTLKLLAKTTDTPQIFKKIISATFRGTEAAIEALGGESATLKQLGGHPETHPLGETFYTQVPVLYGDHIAKLSVAPDTPALKALTDASLPVNGKPDGIREAMLAFFAGQGGDWEMRVQLCTDLTTMPVEDASTRWPEDQSPFVTVGRIRVEPQTAWSDARSDAVDDRLAFSPWHGLAAHRPLGSIMRVRKSAYEMSAAFRAEHNRKPVEEPASLDRMPA